MTPGPIHEKMAKDNGEWTYEMTMWYSPGAEPMKSEGTCTNEMLYGRYQKSIYKGTFMGQPFEGIATMAYDNGKKIFQSTWIDNMGTGILVSEGKWNEGTKTITLKGKGYDPSTGKDEMMRETIQFVDEDHQTMQMYSHKNDKEFKSMEIKFTRKK